MVWVPVFSGSVLVRAARTHHRLYQGKNRKNRKIMKKTRPNSSADLFLWLWFVFRMSNIQSVVHPGQPKHGLFLSESWWKCGGGTKSSCSTWNGSFQFGTHWNWAEFSSLMLATPLTTTSLCSKTYAMTFCRLGCSWTLVLDSVGCYLELVSLVLSLVFL